MFHPLIKTLATQPHLLIDHLGAYADLVGLQTAAALQGLRTRAVLVVALAVAVLLAGMLSGVALLMFAVTPLERMVYPWLLLVVPGMPWLLAAALGLGLRAQTAVRHFEPVREQFVADAALLKEAAQA